MDFKFNKFQAVWNNLNNKLLGTSFIDKPIGILSYIYISNDSLLKINAFSFSYKKILF